MQYIVGSSPDNIGICCFSAKHAALRRKRKKKRLSRNQDNVSEWGDMSIRGLLFQWTSTIKIQLSVLVYYKTNIIIISLKINLLSLWCSWKIAELPLNSNHSLTNIWWRPWKYLGILKFSLHVNCQIEGISVYFTNSTSIKYTWQGSSAIDDYKYSSWCLWTIFSRKRTNNVTVFHTSRVAQWVR